MFLILTNEDGTDIVINTDHIAAAFPARDGFTAIRMCLAGEVDADYRVKHSFAYFCDMLRNDTMRRVVDARETGNK